MNKKTPVAHKNSTALTAAEAIGAMVARGSRSSGKAIGKKKKISSPSKTKAETKTKKSTEKAPKDKTEPKAKPSAKPNSKNLPGGAIKRGGPVGNKKDWQPKKWTQPGLPGITVEKVSVKKDDDTFMPNKPKNTNPARQPMLPGMRQPKKHPTA